MTGRSGCAEASRPRHEYDELVRLVPLALAQRYLAAGWVVKPMRGHHGRYSALASRWVIKDEQAVDVA